MVLCGIFSKDTIYESWIITNWFYFRCCFDFGKNNGPPVSERFAFPNTAVKRLRKLIPAKNCVGKNRKNNQIYENQVVSVIENC